MTLIRALYSLYRISRYGPAQYILAQRFHGKSFASNSSMLLLIKIKTFGRLSQSLITLGRKLKLVYIGSSIRDVQVFVDVMHVRRPSLGLRKIN